MTEALVPVAAEPAIVTSGGRPSPRRRVAAPRGRLHPYSPGLGPDREAALGRDPHARRLARRQPSPPREPRGRGPWAEAHRHQGVDAGPVSGRGAGPGTV